jgi:CBS domain-containing membrane protein
MGETDNRESSAEGEGSGSETARAKNAPNETAASDGAPAEAKPDDGPAATGSAGALDDTPAVAAAATPADTADESEPDSTVEVDPEVVESVRGAKRPVVDQRLPPPPPSARIKGTSRLEVTGNPRLARDLMTKKIFTIGPNDIIEHLEQHMQAFRFRHLPVVEGRKLVGLITHSDLLHASSSFLSDMVKERDELIHKLPASRVMQRELLTVHPTDTLVQVTSLMWEARVGCVLVTEEDGTLVGIITEADFIRLAHHYLLRDAATPI